MISSPAAESIVLYDFSAACHTAFCWCAGLWEHTCGLADSRQRSGGAIVESFWLAASCVCGGNDLCSFLYNVQSAAKQPYAMAGALSGSGSDFCILDALLLWVLCLY